MLSSSAIPHPYRDNIARYAVLSGHAKVDVVEVRDARPCTRYRVDCLVGPAGLGKQTYGSVAFARWLDRRRASRRRLLRDRRRDGIELAL